MCYNIGMSVQLTSPLLVAEKPPIDEASFVRIMEADDFASEVYRQLALPDDEVDRQIAIFENTVANPDLRAQHLDEVVLDQQETQLLATKQAILADESLDPEAKQAYRWRINELIANVRMARASANGDMKRFRRYNEFIYGKPRKDIAEGVVASFRNDATALLASEHESVREAAEEVLRMLPEVDPASKDILVPSTEVFDAARTESYRELGFFGLVLAGVELPEGVKVTPEAGEPAMNQVLHNIGAAHYGRGFQKGGWGVSHLDQKVLGPETYNLPYNRFVGLVAGHEIASHILERINGLRSGFMLAGAGLDRYESGNEGRAVIREQLPYETIEEFTRLVRWQDILRRHLSITLGYGSFGDGPKDYASVGEIIGAVDRLWERAKAPHDVATADAKAQKRTRDLLKRTLKGTDGRGGAYQKDMVYLEGNVACWEAISQNPRLLALGDLGKFDITNSRHIALLQKLGVLPVDMEQN
jgi:hypothetical protein